MAISKALKASYNKYGIAVSGDKISTPAGMVAPLLKQGNTKTGKKVWTFSTLPTNKVFSTACGDICGTCPCNCTGCYATKGNYNFKTTRNSLAINTLLCRDHLDIVNKMIRAQLDTLPGVDIRIHAAGDFFGDEYANMWRDIVKDYPTNNFWTYTKVAKYESLFDDLPNGNIVKSIIPACGFNFGHIEYIAKAYIALVNAGATPYVCRCTFDDMQHCEGCRGCIEHKHVLFVEHSTEYKAKADPLFSVMSAIVDMQKNASPADIAARLADMIA